MKSAKETAGRGASRSLIDRIVSFATGSEPPPLGQVLVRERIITDEQLRIALEIQQNDPQRLGQIILEQGFASEVEILQAIAKEYGVSADSLADDIRIQIHRRPRTILRKFAGVRIPIRAKLSIAITFIIWLTILTLSFIMLARQKGSFYEQTLKMGKVSLNYFVSDAAVPLLEDDIVRLNALIKEARFAEGLLYAAIVDRKGTVPPCRKWPARRRRSGWRTCPTSGPGSPREPTSSSSPGRWSSARWSWGEPTWPSPSTSSAGRSGGRASMSSS